ncbi:MAG: DUF1573 domain-containing protein [Lentisphaeria bacterium]
MKSFVMTFALLFSIFLCAAEPGAKEVPALPELPVEVVEGKELDLGMMYGNEVRLFQFTVKNISNKPLEYKRIAVNCSCSRLKVKVPGTIAPGEELQVPVELDARKIREKGAFKKAIRFDFPGYRQLVLIFTGRMSNEIRILMDVDGEERLAKTVPVTFIEKVIDNWERTLLIKADFTDGRKLEFGEPVLQDPASHRCQLTRIAENHWLLKVLPALPQKLGLIKNEVILPMQTPNASSSMRLSLEGMVGTRIEASVDELYWDPKTDPGQAKKTFSLTRLPFNDRIIRVATLLGRPNPYMGVIKVLTPAEVKVPKVPGVDFKLEQGRGGVYVHCHMQGNKIPAEGVEGEFLVENSEGCSVCFAVMDEATRKALQELGKDEDEKAVEGTEDWVEE